MSSEPYLIMQTPETRYRFPYPYHTLESLKAAPVHRDVRKYLDHPYTFIEQVDENGVRTLVKQNDPIPEDVLEAARKRRWADFQETH